MDLCNINDIKGLLSRHGFHFSRSMGQNFLVDSSIPEKISELSQIDETCGVVEIGPGIGSLTVSLAKRAKKVFSVELDKSLLPVLSETLKDYSNVEILSANALKIDFPEIIKDNFDGLRPFVCANIPYNITSPLLSKLIDDACFESITVMVQREVAKRICALPSTPDYGAFTIYVNFFTEAKILFDVPPDSFIPQPKVWSSVIILKRRTLPPAEIQNERLFFKIVKSSFAQRRKTLVNGLFAIFGDKLSKIQLAQMLNDCGYSENIRGEALDINGFAKITNYLSGKLFI
jgi:16S rRNA (adenine1518-N6/adenine1519-N6)-dimethyltransferase